MATDASPLAAGILEGGRDSYRVVLGAIVDHGPLSQSDVVETTGLHRATVHHATDVLEAAGYVTESDDDSDGRRTIYEATRQGEQAAREVRDGE